MQVVSSATLGLELLFCCYNSCFFRAIARMRSIFNFE